LPTNSRRSSSLEAKMPFLTWRRSVVAPDFIARTRVEDPIFTPARSIASFLSAEYGLDTQVRRMFVAELTVEMALRMAEGLSGD
jgi:hypothetical protein